MLRSPTQTPAYLEIGDNSPVDEIDRKEQKRGFMGLFFDSVVDLTGMCYIW